MEDEQVVTGPCGEKLGKWSSVKAQPVDRSMAEKTTIRWLIRKEDGAPTFAMRLFELEPEAHIYAHRHPWEHEIFVLEGKGRIRIGAKIYDVEQGMFVFIPPNVEHEYWNTGNSIMRFLCLIPHKATAEERVPECEVRER